MIYLLAGGCACVCRSRGGCRPVWAYRAKVGRSGLVRLIRRGLVIYIVGVCVCVFRGQCWWVCASLGMYDQAGLGDIFSGFVCMCLQG